MWSRKFHNPDSSSTNINNSYSYSKSYSGNLFNSIFVSGYSMSDVIVIVNS